MVVQYIHPISGVRNRDHIIPVIQDSTTV